MANKSDVTRDQWMLTGPLARRGYDWWWHSFTAIHAETGEEKAFYVEFFTCNPALAKAEPKLVWNDPAAQKKGERPSYLMVNAGFWGEKHGQLHRFFPWKDVRINLGTPFEIEAGDCFLNETASRGSISVSEEEAAAHPEWMSDAGSMSWDFTISKKTAFHVGYGAGDFFRRLNAFEMFWHAEGMKTDYSGTVTLNGETYLLTPETSFGYADKNWGGDFTSPWVWLSSCRLTSRKTGKVLENSVFNIGGGRPKVFGLALDRKLLGELYYEGKDYEFNFSKFWTLSQTAFKCSETETEIRWHVVQTTLTAKLDTVIRCRKQDMLNIAYEAPDGTKRHNRLWNGGNGTGILKLYRRSLFGRDKLIDEIEARSIGCEYGEYCDPVCDIPEK